jgi:hypothetical protein
VRSLLPGAAIAVGSAFGLTEWLSGGDTALFVGTLLCACSVATAMAAALAPLGAREVLEEERFGERRTLDIGEVDALVL